MKVRKRAPDVLRVAGTSVRTADREIRTKKRYLKKGFKTFDKEAEENEEETGSKAQSLFLEKRVSYKTVQERYRRNQRKQAETGRILEKEKGYEETVKSQRSRQGSGRKENIQYQPFKIKSVLEDVTAKKEAGQLKEEADSDRNKIPDFIKTGKGAGKKAAKASAEAAAEAAVGAAAGGVSLPITAAVRAAKMATAAAREMKEALQASVIRDDNEKQTARPSGGTWGIIALTIAAGAIPFLMVVTILIPFLFLGSVFTLQELNGANRIVLVARGEISTGEVSDGSLGGQKYKEWYGMDDDWCAIFVSWCADQCGYINMDIMPKTASVDTMKTWYQDREQYHEKDGYEPKMGDIIFFGNGISHVGIVAEYDAESGIVITVEGNTGISNATPYHTGSQVKQCSYPVTYDKIIGYATPKYPLEVIEIPEPYGTEYSYMGWQMITSTSSKQYKLREEAGMNFDADGFGKIGDRYVIACTNTFGQVGDYIDWELDNGTVIETVIGDIKNRNDDGCNEWGHRNGLCVVEFVVDKESWYGKGKYPTDFHPEWEGRTIRATKVGSFWQQ